MMTVAPHVLYPTTGSQFTVNQSDALTIICNATALPMATLSWYKQGVPINSTGDLADRVTIGTQSNMDHTLSDGTVQLSMQVLSITSTRGYDTGSFQCIANNTAKLDNRTFEIFVQGQIDILFLSVFMVFSFSLYSSTVGGTFC